MTRNMRVFQIVRVEEPTSGDKPWSVVARRPDGTSCHIDLRRWIVSSDARSALRNSDAFMQAVCSPTSVTWEEYGLTIGIDGLEQEWRGQELGRLKKELEASENKDVRARYDQLLMDYHDARHESYLQWIEDECEPLKGDPIEVDDDTTAAELARRFLPRLEALWFSHSHGNDMDAEGWKELALSLVQHAFIQTDKGDGRDRKYRPIMDVVNKAPRRGNRVGRPPDRNIDVGVGRMKRAIEAEKKDGKRLTQKQAAADAAAASGGKVKARQLEKAYSERDSGKFLDGGLFTGTEMFTLKYGALRIAASLLEEQKKREAEAAAALPS